MNNPLYLFTKNPGFLAYIPLLTGLELILQAASVLLPGIATARRRILLLATLWRLWPLWRVMTDAVPDVTLPGSASSRIIAAMNVAGLRWRLHRLVIELRDVGLVLRAYVMPATISAARRFVLDRGVPPADADAAALACWFEAARRAKIQDKAPSAMVSEVPGPGGENLDEEVDFFLNVARFHATSLPADFVQQLSMEVA